MSSHTPETPETPEQREFRLREEGERLLALGLPTETEQGFNAMNEMFVTLKSSGFSRFESLWLIGFVLNNGAKIQDEDMQP